MIYIVDLVLVVFPARESQFKYQIEILFTINILQTNKYTVMFMRVVGLFCILLVVVVILLSHRSNDRIPIYF